MIVWVVAVAVHESEPWDPWESENPLSGNNYWFKAEGYSFHNWELLGTRWPIKGPGPQTARRMRCIPVGEGPTRVHSLTIQFSLPCLHICGHSEGPAVALLLHPPSTVFWVAGWHGWQRYGSCPWAGKELVIKYGTHMWKQVHAVKQFCCYGRKVSWVHEWEKGWILESWDMVSESFDSGDRAEFKPF